MEKQPVRRFRRCSALLAIALSTTALPGCSISVDSYLTDASNVRCDGRRTEVDLARRGMATFIVHGKLQTDVATVKVRRNEAGASVAVSGDVTGPTQQLTGDRFTSPTPVVDGPELSAFAAGAAWAIDVREATVVINGTC